MATWQEFTSIPNGTRIFNHGFDQCVALANHYHENVLGGSFVPVNSAYQWWTDFERLPQLTSKYTKSLNSEPGAIFVSRGGIYDATHGHIGVVLDDDDTFIYTLEQNAGTWRYVGRYKRGMANIYGFLIPINNPAHQKPSETQRVVGSNPANRRAAPSITAPVKEPQLAPGAVGNFTGWIYGDRVNDGINNTDIWYRGVSGDWFWAGAFTSLSTAGLTDLNPQKPTPPVVHSNQRQVDPIPVNIRAQATTNSDIVGSLDSNAIVTPAGWIRGQEVQGIPIWYKIDGGWAWAGGFTKEDTSGLTDLNPAEPAPVDPPDPTDPTGPVGDLGSPGPVLATIENWSESAPNFGTSFPRPEPATAALTLPSFITERVVTPQGGFYTGREGSPNHIVLHHGAQPNLAGLVATLSGANNSVPTANYAIKDSEVVAMVDEADTPSTNTRWKSNTRSVTIEIANNVTTTDKPSPESHEAAAWVVARAALRWGMLLPLAQGVTVFGHKEVSKLATACPGLLDVGWITNRANQIIEAFQDQEPVVPPVDGSGSLAALTEAVNGLTSTLTKIYRVD